MAAEEGNLQRLGGEALATLLDGLAGDPEAAALALAPGDLPFFLGALLADVPVSRPAAAGARVHIWGALEARLQAVDCLILGGLDEGVWPSGTRTDPWLSRAMRSAIGLPAPERRIGLSAHDFFQGLAAPRVIVSRAEKRGGAPTVESRWLQRLHALVGAEAAAAFAARGARYVALARAIDRVDRPAPVKRPEPRPPLAVRPTRLSITEIETLIRDPYAIYAKHILKLRPLDPLGRPPDASLRGTLIHDAIGRFTNEWRGPYGPAAEARLRAIGEEVLREIADFPDVHAVWSIRFAAIAGWMARFEAARDDRVAERHAEIDGKLPILVPGSGVFLLSGRADRVDRMADGSFAIYDFKTGTPQTERSVFAGLTPQMTLEAAVARAGGFDGLGGKDLSVSELAWLAIGKVGRDDPYVSAVPKNRKETADQLADRALAMLTALVAAFADAGHPYRSRLRPRMENARYQGDYDHLARVREWALVESDEDVAAMGPAP
jgi:ATP-dependent helicase/nuclease subunit B